MKRNNILVIFLGLLIGFSSCEDLLKTEPRFALTPSSAFADSGNVVAQLALAYRRVHGFGYYGQQLSIMGDALADNVHIANNTGRYTNNVTNEVFSHYTFWPNPYAIINDCNFVIDVVDDVVMSTNLRNRLIAEARFLRALAHHDIARAYGYEPGREVGGWDKSAIIRDAPVRGLADANSKGPRNTNLEVYQFIEADLLEAITLFETLPAAGNAAANLSFPSRANVAAARALLARVYLYWGRYADAVTAANDALASPFTATLSNAANYLNTWNTPIHPEALFEANIGAPDWGGVDGINNSLQSLTSNEGNGNFSIGASAELLAAYEPGDIRRDIWVEVPGIGVTGSSFACRKYRGEGGTFRENLPLIRISEVYLTLAEAHARNNNSADAQAAINTLRTNRGLAATTLVGQDLIDLIMNERRVELGFEGHRLFDLKRNGLNIPKPALYGGTPLQFTDFRVLAPISIDEIRVTPGLEQNPNYQ